MRASTFRTRSKRGRSSGRPSEHRSKTQRIRFSVVLHHISLRTVSLCHPSVVIRLLLPCCRVVPAPYRKSEPSRGLLPSTGCVRPRRVVPHCALLELLRAGRV